MNAVNHNFDMVAPRNLIKNSFSPTPLQLKGLKQFLRPYDVDLEFITNKYNTVGRKILIVTDNFATYKTTVRDDELTDLDRGCVFSGKEGQTLQNVIAFAVGKSHKQEQLSEIAVLNWTIGELKFKANSMRVEDKTNLDFYYSVCYERLVSYIQEYKPDVVIMAGVDVFDYTISKMTGDHTVNNRLRLNRLLSVSIPDSRKKKFQFALNKKKKPPSRYKFQMMGTIDCHRFCAWDTGAKTFPNLIGYFASGLTQAINGRNTYTIQLPEDIRFINVNTIEKFDRLMKQVWKEEIVSLDTETAGLGRVVNTLFTIQFCYDGKNGYLVPIDHPNTPFTVKERKYIKEELARYFEHGKSLYHIYQGGKFDFSIYMACLGVRFYNHRLYDVQYGEYALEENIKLLSLWNRKSDERRFSKPYALDFICERYGCSIYRKISFSKGSRGQIATEGLTKRFIEYSCYDVILPFLIHQLQIKEAKKRGYDKFIKFVCEQLGDTGHACAQLEHTGVLMDRRVLFELRSRDGAIAKSKRELLNKFKQSKAARRVNSYLMKKEGVPAGNGIFGDSTWLFDIDKNAHQQLLFINALKLEPTGYTKLNDAQINKAFLKTYAKIPEVSYYQEYKAIKTLEDNFIGPISDKLKEDVDCRADSRLRVSYDLIRVSTGRLSSFNLNLQNIPQRGPLAKKIKAAFIAKMGSIFVKNDFSAHEVRDWANESGDEGLIGSFYIGMQFRQKLRVLAYKYEKNIEEWSDIRKRTQWDDFDKDKKPIRSYDDKIAILKTIDNKITKLIGATYLDLEAKGDLHKLNCERFFKVAALEVTEDQRYEIKAVVFGVIYGKTAAGLAKPKSELGLGKSEEYCQELIDSLFAEFKQGGDYIYGLHRFGRENLYVESPLGMQRHLWGYLHARQSIQNAMDRRGPNSIIQGVASSMGVSSIRIMQRLIWNFFVKHDVPFNWRCMVNDVHDSVESETEMHNVPIYLYMMEKASTTLVHRRYADVFDYNLKIGLELEFQMGASLDRVSKWDFCHDTLFSKIQSEMQFQEEKFGYKVNQDKVMKKVKHNWNIVRDYRLRELESALESKEAVEHSMLITSKNVRDIGLIM